MSKNDFENKIKKSESNRTKPFRLSDIEIQNIKSNVPIGEQPPYPAAYEPAVNIGDLVSHVDDEQEEVCGIAIDAHWHALEKSVRFSKRLGEWVRKYECVPRATVMWRDGLISDVPMNLLIRKDVE